MDINGQKDAEEGKRTWQREREREREGEGESESKEEDERNLERWTRMLI